MAKVSNDIGLQKKETFNFKIGVSCNLIGDFINLLPYKIS